MRVGILTFHRAVNYGACLQAYALKKYIEGKKIDVSIIDYRSKYIEDLYNNPFSKGLSIKTKLKNAMTWNIQKERNKKFNDFINDYLQCNEKSSIFDKEKLENIGEKFDKIIVGSDQVWNTLCAANDTTYYLDFVKDNQKKYSYAASLGIVNDEYYKLDNLKELLIKFNRISVREKNGYDVIKKITGRESTICLDPTFLLSKTEWEKISTKKINEKYILVYSLSMPQSIVTYAQELSKKMNMKVVFFTLNNLFSLKKRKDVVNGSPIDFLDYFSNAEYIVTNSFHGTAFSLIFNKNFTVFKNSNKNHDNSRLENILSITNLRNRMIEEGENQFFEEIDYENINEKLNAEIEKSKKYLEDILE